MALTGRAENHGGGRAERQGVRRFHGRRGNSEVHQERRRQPFVAAGQGARTTGRVQETDGDDPKERCFRKSLSASKDEYSGTTVPKEQPLKKHIA